MVGEREQLPAQAGRVLGLLLNLLEVPAHRACSCFLQGQLRPGQNGEHRVVEVVGRPAGQQPERLHLLRLTKLLFELLVLGDIQQNRTNAHRLPPGVANQVFMNFEHQTGAVPANVPAFKRGQALFAGDLPTHGFTDGFRLIGSNQFPDGLSQNLLGFKTQQGAHSSVDTSHDSLAVGLIVGDRRLFKQAAELLCGFL